MEAWKKRIYDTYVTNLFGMTHEADDKENNIQAKYFKKNYLKYMPKNKKVRILDLGCGMGHFYYACKKYGYRNYEGIDASKENVAFIKKKWGRKTNVSVKDMATFLNESKGGYDVVFFNDVIEHLTKQEIFETLDGIHKIMNKGGVLFIKTPNMANPFVSAAGRYICMDHEIGFTEKSMSQLLITTGFKHHVIIGTDIYVLNPVLSIPAKCVSKIINAMLYLLSCLYGRTSIKIFEKDILAIAHKW